MLNSCDLIKQKYSSGIHIWELYSTPDEIKEFLPESIWCLIFDHDPLVIFEANGYELVLQGTKFNKRSKFPHGTTFIEVKDAGRISWF